LASHLAYAAPQAGAGGLETHRQGAKLLLHLMAGSKEDAETV
jgi:hypothetical protein